jgi:hypothetical protein
VYRSIALCAAALLLPVTSVIAQTVIQTENAKAGTTAWQITNPATNREIEGYASLTSVPRGGTISFFVDTADATFQIEIFRVGWYGGPGGRRMTQPVQLAGTRQAIPVPDPTTGLTECNWINPYVLTIPNDSDASEWASGVYLAKLTGLTSTKQSYIIFVVRDDARGSKYFVQTSVATYQAYNNWGGKSLYPTNSTNAQPAQKVSFNRPYAFDKNTSNGAGEFFYWESNFVRFLEREGYDVTYGTDLDVHENPNLLLSHKAFISMGHDEYWSWQMRSNVTAARDQGINLGFFGADTMDWQVRFEPSTVNGATDRTMVCYRSLSDPVYLAGNPIDYHLVTVQFRAYPVNSPQDALIGVMNDYQGSAISGNVVIADAASPVFANAGLQNGSALPGLLGYQVDRMFGNAPSNTQLLARSPYSLNGVTHYADMTIYNTPSGTTVFAAGTMNWAWGLDGSFANPAVQQATRNLLTMFVGGNRPLANPGGPYAGSPNQPIQFNGGGSFDAGGTLVAYDWNFGDGATGTGIAPTHAYGATGTYTVQLTVTDGQGSRDAATTTATITVPSLSAPATSKSVLTQAAVSSALPTFPNGYAFQQAITINHTMVPNTDQTNFPVLFSGVYPYLATTANGGSATNAQGDDIIFTADSAGTQLLNFEQEKYVATTGEVEYWIRIPTLSHTADTIIYMFYGNANVTSFQSTPTAVWDSTFAAVYHLADNAASATVKDSTASNVTGTANRNTNNTATSGQIDGAMAFNGSTDTVTANGAAINVSGSFSVEVWVNTPANANTAALLTNAAGVGGNGYALQLYYSTPVFGANGGGYYSVSARNITSNVWHHIVGTRSGTRLSIYVDGVLANTATGANSTPANNVLNIGDYGGTGEYFSGTLDEIRVSNTARSADWVATEYQNQFSPSTFYSVGPAISGGGGSSPNPSITSLSPTSGPAGTLVTITGTNFGATQGSSTVTFNGTSVGTVTPASNWSSSITVAVPTGATSGNVVVTVNGLASNGASFTVTVAPSISGLSPNSGPVGTSVTITGTNFGSTQGTSTVTFNGTAAMPTSWGATSIVAPVPSGATTGNVIVTVGGLGSNGASFTVTSVSALYNNVGNSLIASADVSINTSGTPTTLFSDHLSAPTSLPCDMCDSGAITFVNSNTTATNVWVIVSLWSSNSSAPTCIFQSTLPSSSMVVVPYTCCAYNASVTAGTRYYVNVYAQASASGVTAKNQLSNPPYGPRASYASYHNVVINYTF